MSDSLFSQLNHLRPANAGFGEVTSIRLVYSINRGEWDPLQTERFVLGHTKRKSIHVPPSSNAYWNEMALRSLLTELFTREGVDRSQRQVLRASLRSAVMQIHQHSLCQAYGWGDAKVDHEVYPMFCFGDWANCTQYYDLILCDNRDPSKPDLFGSSWWGTDFLVAASEWYTDF